MSFVTQAKALFKKDTEKERASLKASAGKLKEKYQQLKQEVAYRKSPEYVEQRIAEEKSKLELNKRKQELAELKRQNSPLNSVRNYLASVKAKAPRQQTPRPTGQARNILGGGHNIIYDQEPTSRLNMFELGQEKVADKLTKNKPKGIMKL